MPTIFCLLLSCLCGWARSHAALQAEILALRHQLLVLQRSTHGQRLRSRTADRIFWVWLSRLWQGWRSAVKINEGGDHHLVESQGIPTVLDMEEPGTQGPTARDSGTDPNDQLGQSTLGCTADSWQLMKLGVDIGETTVAKYMARPRRPSSQTWKTFLKNHIRDMVSTDFFVVPMATFRLLFVFLVLSHDRRRVVHFAVTSHPTAEWTAQQLRHAFPWDTAPRYLLRDRDSCYGEQFHSTTRAMGIHEVLTAPRSPWQNAFVERLIGSIRRECLDHVLTFNERGLRRILRSYFDYYERLRTHLALNKDAPVPRAVQPPATGRVIAVPQVGGLHHRYERQTAQRAA